MKYRTAEASLRMIHPETAEATHQSSEGAFPAIPATSRMIELMEIAAARLMKSHMRDGESSVAVAMNVTYAAASLRHRQRRLDHTRGRHAQRNFRPPASLQDQRVR